ncbi:MAG: ribose 5-phosphate isomerase B [Oscillospiraceae bacterium]|nr:ribose 5-phosphate isomerase B [Oscillospiraceae bacterium]MBQ8010545.1 ribose 5-phosphate isomerase B [Oscillospiraceae bacterium]MBQ9110369.1 ribose 5-phosphate isomerase B [Oscillospiraceae bacterium]
MIAIGCDHAACGLKKAVMAYLDEKNIPYLDCGTEEGVPCDYPDMAEKVCLKITSGEAEKGILLCGTGIGMSMAANKIKGIRAACASDCFSVKYTRLHNDCNVLCMGQRVVGHGLALELVELFLNTEFEGGRHQRRVDLITALEEK